jgi:hypothetical protein
MWPGAVFTSRMDSDLEPSVSWYKRLWRSCEGRIRSLPQSCPLSRRVLIPAQSDECGLIYSVRLHRSTDSVTSVQIHC